ncbi:MAG: hypothetical protein NVS2B17_19920 [Candidatus Velthaea sp.]
MLYLSAYFERRRTEYYDALLKVSTHGAWDEWLAFFLEGVATQSRERRSEPNALRNYGHVITFN